MEYAAKAIGQPSVVQRRRVSRMATAFLLSTTFLAGAGAARAQETAAAAASVAPASELDAVVVTARRKEENLQSVPVAVTVVSSKVLESFRFEDLKNLSAMEPSFSVSASSGRPNSPVYSLRGIRPTESVYGQDPTVAIYLADVVQSPAQGSNLGFYDLENIQVLKGPQGTLFGRNTIGGAILLTPRKPGGDFGGEIMVGAGSFDMVETQIGINIPVAEKFHLRLAGRTIDGGDYQTNVAPGPLNGTKLGGQTTRSVRLTGVADLTSNASNTTMLTYDSKHTNSRGAVLQAVNPAHPRAGATPGLFAALDRAQHRSLNDVESDLRQKDNVEAWSVTNTTVAKLTDDIDFKLIAAYREVETDTLYDLDATIVPNILTTEQQASLNHGSVEAQLQGRSFDGKLDWVAGLYYYAEDGLEYSPGSFFGAHLIQSGEVKNKSYSAFAQGSYHFTPNLTLTGGMRLNKDKRGMTIRQNSNGTLCLLQVANSTNTGLVRLPITDCQVDLSDSFSQPTGTVSLDYKVTPDILLYASSRLGYRSGGFNLRGSQPVQYEPFKPETVRDIEVGSKADWKVGDVALRTNLAVFYQKYDDIQRTVAVATSLGSPASVVINAASATVFGVELQQTIRPVEHLTLQFNGSYNDPKYKNWIDPATSTDLSTTPFFFTPKYSGNAMATYEASLPGDLGTLRFGANAAYTGEVWINALHTITIINQHPASLLPLLKQDAYWLVDANIAWQNIKGSNVDLSIYGKNLTATKYKIGGIQLYTGASGFITAAYGDPRTFGAQLRYHF